MVCSPACLEVAFSATEVKLHVPSVCFPQEAVLFDILVYLYESYFHADFCPETEQLAHSLSAAGFEQEEISSTLDWFASLRDRETRTSIAMTPTQDSVRLYSDFELQRLNTECRAYLGMLENSGVLTAGQRERIIDGALALENFTIHLSRLKVIVLMVLWQHAHPIDILMVDELLGEELDGDFAPLLH